MYRYIRPLLFSLDEERAHALTLGLLHYVPRAFFVKPPEHIVRVMGLEFPHRLGLAAGLDKNGEHLDALAKLGFAFIEIGTITPRPQTGQLKPRLFRLPQAQALINRMGFNNHGVEAVLNNLRKTRYQGILGVNIGKNKDTSLIDAASDYIYCLRQFYAFADYITLNISSPNTQGLRELQQTDYFYDLVHDVCQTRQLLMDEQQRYVPLLVKISPDESDETLKQIANIMLTLGLDGIIATNTTCSRAGVEHIKYGDEAGGLSGAPLLDASTHSLRVLKAVVGDDLTLIGVGGVSDLTSAQAKMDAGASLLQVYTGLLYQGPSLIQNISLMNEKRNFTG